MTTTETMKEKRNIKTIDEIDATFEELFFSMRDGVSLRVRVRWGLHGRASPVMLFAAPLGAEDCSLFMPIISEYKDRFTYVEWNYRGLFASDMPRRHKRISIRDHADDAVELLDKLEIQVVDVLVGYSMGVQVALETVLLFPERVNSLILINGAYGQVFQTAFQPFFRIPAVGTIASKTTEYLLRKNPNIFLNAANKLLSTQSVETLLYYQAKYFGSEKMKELYGSDNYLNIVLQQYTHHLAATTRDSENYIRLFQELNAHDTYHLLGHIEQPTLCISGRFDCLTPHFLMEEMAQRMPNAEHFCDNWSSHATLFENPEFLLEHTNKFLCDKNSLKNSYLRSSSTRFALQQHPSTSTVEC